MAFNPFEAFSVRSKLGKSVMAVLGIVVMLTFVLSTGAVGSGMDFFDQIGSLFGTRGRGDVIAKAYGDDVRDTELNEVRRQRTAAREYLARALDASYTEWARSLEADVKANRLTGEAKEVVGRFVGLRLKSETERMAYRMYLAQFNPQQFGGGQDLFKIADAYRKVQGKPDSDDKKALDSMLAIITNDIFRQSNLPTMFLVPLDTESDRGVLDFILLLKKADRLGIHFSTEGVRDLVARDTGGRLTEKDAQAIEAGLRTSGRMGNVSTEWLAEAVANEYRAKLALGAVEGTPVAAEEFKVIRAQPFRLLAMLGVDLASTRAPGVLGTESAVAGGVTPYEFFEFYKDRCSEHDFQVLQVAVEAYLEQVKESPSKSELAALFAKHRGDLPDPASDRPGFKEPRKVKVEFVSVDANAPRIAQAVPKVEAAAAFLAATTGALTGDPMAALVLAARPESAAGAPTAPVEVVARQIVQARREANRSRYEGLERFNLTPRDTSIYRPQPIVAALGVLAGHPDFTTATAAAVAVHQQVERIDHQARVPFLLQEVLTPFNPTFGNALGMPALALAHNPPLPPESLYLGEALTTARKDQVRNLFREDVLAMQQKVRKLASGGEENPNPFAPPPKLDKAKLEKARDEAKKYLADWHKDRGLTPAGNAAPEDQFDLAKDPALKPLNDAAIAELDGTNSLSRRLFPDQQSRFPDEVKPFQPFWFPGDPAGASLDKPNHLVWQTEETQAVSYNNLENADRITKGEMTKKVEKAWRLEKARALAKADADKLAEQVKEKARAYPNNPLAIERELRDLAAQRKVREFSLDRMALLKFEHGLNPNQQSYQPPKIEKSLVLYPTPDFTDRLLELRKEPVGAVTVLADSPRAHFYVACLVEKREKTVEQFKEVFDKVNASIGRNPLYAQYALPEERGRAMLDAKLRLRADAGLELKEAFTKRERREDEAP